MPTLPIDLHTVPKAVDHLLSPRFEGDPKLKGWKKDEDFSFDRAHKHLPVSLRKVSPKQLV